MTKLLKSCVLLFALYSASMDQESAESIDPAGDMFGGGTARHDAISTDAVFTDSLLTFTVRFAGQVSPASALTARKHFNLRRPEV